ncbi:Uma2 family endonuclease [Pleurocapsa sp. FMAR1]|uniref:Uma2 family endonuclease n=1 Tax=Pleurocapsa sp. FMAR1 TaxID=3040204 RepID=UPI0029C97694|nr:Uma2 family endonuclease [Pleurocapsa sp. FMAR1]
MTTSPNKAISLDEFLLLPEGKPVQEYIDGKIICKPMPKGKHSRLQLKLCNRINQAVESAKVAYALPKLRCSFDNPSLVPDIAIFLWSRIPFDADGEIPNDFLLSPDWTIEILSPKQRANRVTGNILYCLQHGCQLGWLIDPEDRSILIFFPNRQPVLLYERDRLSVLENIDLQLEVTTVFSWLKMDS